MIRLGSTIALFCVGLAGPVMAQEAFTLSSPAFTEGGLMPADLRCQRDGGDGVSPPLEWTNLPEDTQSLALVMHHYPGGRVEGVDEPSQYWLVWNIPHTTTGLPRGNPASIGDEGSDKDGRHTGYTPPCSPAGAQHEYTITVYALSSPPGALPDNDDLSVGWMVMMAALDGRIIASSSLSFLN